MSQSESNRRRYERKTLHVTAHLLLPGHPPIPVRTLQVSIGGLGIVAAANPPPRLKCSIRFPVPSPTGETHTVEVVVQVVHSVLSANHGGFIVGLEFVNIAKESVVHIERYVSG